MNQQFLIPANSKKSLMIFGLFTSFELILFSCAIAISLFLLIVLPVEQLLFAIIALSPACIIGFLLMPVPHYHNVLTVLKSCWEFYTTRQKFIWKGWCFNDGEEKEK